MHFSDVEGPDEILIAVIDGSYGHHDDDEYNEASEAFLRGLRAEFQTDFREQNVGPGADIPAFETFLRENVIPLLPWIIAAFFSGKPVVENIGAWMDAAKYIGRFFSRHVILGRNGAAALTIRDISIELGEVPSVIELKSYRTEPFLEHGEVIRLGISKVIQSPPRTITLGTATHISEVKADDQTYRVAVQGTHVAVHLLGREQQR